MKFLNLKILPGTVRRPKLDRISSSVLCFRMTPICVRSILLHCFVVENTQNVEVHSISGPHCLYPIITAKISTTLTGITTCVQSSINRDKH